MKPAHSRTQTPGYWALVAAGEPYRLLFPVGAVLGILGVLMWPLFVWNFTAAYPGQVHPRIMVEGFLSCFVVGFLGTALPRLLEVPRVGLGETLAFAIALTGVAVLHFLGHTLWGDGLYFVTLCGFVLLLGMRFRLRKDTPPPSFVLVALGLTCGLAGAGVLVVSQISLSLVPGWGLTVARLLLFQGFLLLPIMGIGAFLLPRFFGQPGRQSFPESVTVPPGWTARAAFALACGGAVVAGFFLEAFGATRWGMALRAIGVVAYFVREIPFHRGVPGGGSLVLGLRIALVSIPLGYAMMAVWPDRVFSFLHVVFITGFGLLTFVVASRVILGHSGGAQFFAAKLPAVRLLAVLFFLAMLTRVTADWMPTLRMNHYAYAALAWTAGILIWAIALLPRVRLVDTGE